jgi:polyisoprenoid-binding protein YceI
MKRLAIAALFAVSGSAFAAPETFVIDNNHTFPSFSYSHFGYSIQTSRFNTVTGNVVFDAEAKTGSVDVTIDTTSVNTGSALFNEHIQAAEFLDTKEFPTATFKSTSVKFDGDKPVSVDGKLTLKGITKDVTLTLTGFKVMPHPMAKKDALGANATVVVKRTDFNMGKYAPYVGDDVTISIAIEAINR